MPHYCGLSVYKIVLELQHYDLKPNKETNLVPNISLVMYYVVVI